MPDTYRLKEVERRLGEDERTSELGVQLVEHGGRLFVQGSVSGQAARDSVLAVVHELCPDCEVVDELRCGEESLGTGPRPAEEIR